MPSSRITTGTNPPRRDCGIDLARVLELFKRNHKIDIGTLVALEGAKTGRVVDITEFSPGATDPRKRIIQVFAPPVDYQGNDVKTVPRTYDYFGDEYRIYLIGHGHFGP